MVFLTVSEIGKPPTPVPDDGITKYHHEIIVMNLLNLTRRYFVGNSPPHDTDQHQHDKRLSERIQTVAKRR